MTRPSRRLIGGAAGIALALVAAGALFPLPAAAHALVAREDLPIPEWLFFWGASLALIVSFILLSVAWREPRLQSTEATPRSEGISRVLLGAPVQVLAGVLGVGLLVLTVYAGLQGTEAPDRNFALTFVFVTFWLGMALLSALFGDVFRAFNPWRAIGRGFAGVFRLVSGGQAAPAPLDYPDRLGYWPAVAGLVGFLWLELVYGAAGTSTGLDPEAVAIAGLIYSAVTFVAMAVYGIETWIERGEAFSVYFRMISKVAPLEVRQGRIATRRPLSGLTGWGEVPGSLALVLVAIGATSYDGAAEGLLEEGIAELFGFLTDLGLGNIAAFRIDASIFLAASIAFVAMVYLLGVRGMRTVRGAPRFRELSRTFAHTLIPIALAYLVAHYFSLFVFQEQAQFTYLLSDPLGDGSDIFGTANAGIDYGLIGANDVWYTQVGALVAGHVAALVLAHDRALAVFEDHRDASRSQYWMLAVMVAFTTLGLLLLSQANA